MSSSDPLSFTVDSSQVVAGARNLDNLTTSAEKSERAQQQHAITSARVAEANARAAAAAAKLEAEQIRLAQAAARLAREQQAAATIAQQMAIASARVAIEEAKAAAAIASAEGAQARAARSALALEAAQAKAALAAKKLADEQAAVAAAAAKAAVANEQSASAATVRVIRRDAAITWAGPTPTANEMSERSPLSGRRASEWLEEARAQRAAADAAEELRAAQERAAKAANDNLGRFQALTRELEPLTSESIRYQRQLQEIDRAVAAGNVSSSAQEANLRAAAQAQHQANLRALEGESALGRLSGALATAAARLALLGGALGAISLAVLTRELVQTAAAYGQLEARLTALSGSQDLARARMNELFQTADRVRAPVGELISLYQRLSLATESMGVGSAEIMRMTETVGALVSTSGAGAAEAAAGLRQLSQAFASGRFQGDEFRSVAENLPAVLLAFQEALGKTQGELRQMAREGKLTAEVMREVLDAAHDKALEDLARMPLTLSQAGTLLGNAWDKYLYDVDRAAAVTPALRDAVMALRDALSNPEVIQATVDLFTQLAKLFRWLAEDVIPFLARNWQGLAVTLATFTAGTGAALIAWALGLAAAFGPLAPLFVGLATAAGVLVSGIMWLVGAFEDEKTALELLQAAHENYGRQIKGTENSLRQLAAIMPEIDKLNKVQAQGFLESAEATLKDAEAKLALMQVSRALAGMQATAADVAYAAADDAYRNELKLRQENPDYNPAIADPYLDQLKARREAAEAAMLANGAMFDALEGDSQAALAQIQQLNGFIADLRKRISEAPEPGSLGGSEAEVRALKETYDRALKIRRDYEEAVAAINAARGPNLSDAEADRLLLLAKEDMTSKLAALDAQQGRSAAATAKEAEAAARQQTEALRDLKDAYDPLGAETDRHLKALKEIDAQLAVHNGLTQAEAAAYRAAEAALHAKNVAAIEEAAVREKSERSRGVHAEVSAMLAEQQPDDYWGGLKAGLDDYVASFQTGHQLMQQIGAQTFQGIEDALVDFVLTGKASFGDLINSMIADLVRFAIQQAIMKPLTDWFGTLFHDGGVVSAVPRFHSGGAVYDFTNADRYHSGGRARVSGGSNRGLAADEVPAILQIGEIVLSRRHVQHLREAGLLDYVRGLVANDNAAMAAGWDFRATGTDGPMAYHDGGSVGGGGGSRPPMFPGAGGGPGAGISVSVDVGGVNVSSASQQGAGRDNSIDPDDLRRELAKGIEEKVVEVVGNMQRPGGRMNPLGLG